MSKYEFQAIRLESWRKVHGSKEPGDPDYGGLKTIDRTLVEYLITQIRIGKPPELFISAWVDQRTWHVSLRLAIPKEDGTREAPSTLDRFFK